MKYRISPKVSIGLRETGSCNKNSLRANDLPVCAGNFPFRAGKIRFVRPFSRPCDDFPIRAGDLPIHAGQLPVRAAFFPSVRLFSDSCEPKVTFLRLLANSGGQKAAVTPFLSLQCW
jgi:hypothetical protein